MMMSNIPQIMMQNRVFAEFLILLIQGGSTINETK